MKKSMHFDFRRAQLESAAKQSAGEAGRTAKSEIFFWAHRGPRTLPSANLFVDRMVRYTYKHLRALSHTQAGPTDQGSAAAEASASEEPDEDEEHETSQPSDISSSSSVLFSIKRPDGKQSLQRCVNKFSAGHSWS